MQSSGQFRGGNYAPPAAYGRPPLETRRPISVPNKSQPISQIKKPIYGQPMPIEDSYDNGKGSAAVYNENAPRVNSENNNRVQFQNSVSGDYSGGSAQTYSDSSNGAAAGNDYKSQNEINYEDGRLKAVSGDYAGGSPVDNEATGYDESNELVNENASKDQAYVSNSAPAVRISGYKKKAKV